MTGTHPRRTRTTSSTCSDWSPADHHLTSSPFHPDAIESHDVLVIGNGPSAITLSFLLSGRWPYYRPDAESSSPHPIDFLHQRLTSLGPDKSLFEMDLDALSQGLTGRSLNRVSVLFDQLQNPNTDFGSQQPSTLQWQYHPEKAIDHVVLGTGLPGGLWYSLRKSKTILTVSRQKWMQLPLMPIPTDTPASTSSDYRISFDSIAHYYRSYVEHFNLAKYFRNQTRVIRVEWCPGLDCWIVDAVTKRCIKTSVTSPPPVLGNSNASNSLLKHIRALTKFRCSAKEVKFTRTRFLAKSVVLATGANSCSPSMLNVPGEAAPFVIHSLDQLDSILKGGTCLKIFRCPLSSPPPLVLIIGSGLSSADALSMLSSSGSSTSFRVIHIFRRSVTDRSLIFNQLSNENLYPEYSQTFKRMKATIKTPLCISCFLRSSGSGPTYQAYHRAVLRHISPGTNRQATLDFLDTEQICSNCSRTLAEQSTFPVSLVLILIGSKPQLDFLPPQMLSKLALHPQAPIDIRENPVRIDTVTHETAAARGLYAVGPLVGDNFVRFVQGGAFAVAADLHKKNASKRCDLD